MFLLFPSLVSALDTTDFNISLSFSDDCTDNFGNQDCTLGGNAAFNDGDNLNGKSVILDGNDFIDLGFHLNGQNTTFLKWFYFTGSQPVSKRWWGAVTTPDNRYYGLFQGDKTMTFQYEDAASPCTSPVLNLPLNQWVMMVVVRDETNGTNILYINDTEVARCVDTDVGALTDDFDLGNFNSEGSQGGAAGITGETDEFLQVGRVLTQSDITELWNDGAGFFFPFAVPITGIIITVNDIYDGTSIQNFTVTIFNSTDAFTNSTSGGSITYNNITQGIYSINISSNETGGYFNRTFLNVNASLAFQADIFQSVLLLKALDALNNETISIFTAVTNRSEDSTTNGQILILATNGTFQLNVTASGFDLLTTNFSLATLENRSLNVSMGSVFSFFLIRETTNNAFNANRTNSTEINIFCPNQTITINMTSAPNATQIINCQFTLMQIVVSYGGIGSYFRTLIPDFSQKNITFYLIDLLEGDIAIQRVVKLFDLTGEFANAKLTVKRAVGGTIRTIIEQRFDIASETNLFLIKDALYTLSIDNGIEEIVLGNLIPTEAGTQTITLPKIDFVPTEIVLGGNISWTYTFNVTQGILRVQYVDRTNLTTLVRFTVFNATNNQVFLGESDNNSTVTMTFNQVLGNASYRSELFFDHPGMSNHTDKKVFYGFLGPAGALDLEGWSVPEQQNIKKWFAWIFLFFWGLLFSRIHAGLAMTTMIIFLWLFRQWQWIIIDDIIFGFVALIAVISWIVEAMKKN